MEERHLCLDYTRIKILSLRFSTNDSASLFEMTNQNPEVGIVKCDRGVSRPHYDRVSSPHSPTKGKPEVSHFHKILFYRLIATEV